METKPEDDVRQPVEEDDGEPIVPDEEPEQEQPEEDEPVAVISEDDKPLTPEEIRGAAIDLYAHAKDMWLRPIRKEVRHWFRMSKEFLGGISEDEKSK